MPTEQLTYVPDILEEHLEEIQVLLMLRAQALRSPTAYLRHVAELDERLLAHVDGVLAAGDAAIEPLSTRLGSEDPDAVGASAFALLHVGTPSALARLRDAYASATDDRLLAIASAITLGPGAPLLETAKARLRDTDRLTRVVSCGVVVRHSGWRPAVEDIADVVGDGSAVTRAAAWRLSGELRIALDAKSLAAGMRDEDASARREAMIAAARCGLPGILSVVRSAAEKPTSDEADALRLLIVLAGPSDATRVRYVLTDRALGQLGCELIGLFGAPTDVSTLLELMHDENARVAVAAGSAYQRMTGFNVESTDVVQLPPEDGSQPDAFETEFLDEANLPDEKKAREHWARVGPTFAEATRICAGRDLSAAPQIAQLDACDMEARWWQIVRGQFHGAIGAEASRTQPFPHRIARLSAAE